MLEVLGPTKLNQASIFVCHKHKYNIGVEHECSKAMLDSSNLLSLENNRRLVSVLCYCCALKLILDIIDCHGLGIYHHI